MAIKGLSIPICAKEKTDATGQFAGYKTPFVADHAVEYSLEVEETDRNDFYADNKVQETDLGHFQSGTLTLTTADLQGTLAKKILGIKKITRLVDGQRIDEVVYDEKQEAPAMAFGIIEEHQIDNVTQYVPVILTKVRFNIPAKAATTREDEIDWQTTEIEAAVTRLNFSNDIYTNPWMISPAGSFDTEAKAKAYIETVLKEIGTDDDTAEAIPETITVATWKTDVDPSLLTTIVQQYNNGTEFHNDSTYLGAAIIHYTQSVLEGKKPTLTNDLVKTIMLWYYNSYGATEDAVIRYGDKDYEVFDYTTAPNPDYEED